MTKKTNQNAVEAVTLPAAMSIRNIDEIYGLVSGALSGRGNVVLGIDKDADPDLCVIQLLEVARLDAEKKGGALKLAEPANENIRKTLDRSGLSSGAGGGFTQFWYHQENVQ